MSDKTQPQLQHLSTVPRTNPSSDTSTPECDVSDDVEYAEALVTEIEALANEAKVLLERSVRLSARLREVCGTQQCKPLRAL
jgi:hypothetical protein